MKTPTTWETVKEEIAESLMNSFEISCAWPGYSSFADICDDLDANPSASLYCECIQIAQAMWNNVKIGVKKEIAENESK